MSLLITNIPDSNQLTLKIGKQQTKILQGAKCKKI